MGRRSRQERIVTQLQEIARDLSGYPLEELKPEVSFLELGFDSLFLTQLSTAYKKVFGIQITFRQLFDQYPSMIALSGLIDSVLPAVESIEESAAEPEVATTTRSEVIEAPEQPAPPIRQDESAVHPMILHPAATPTQRPRESARAPLNGIEAILLQQLDLMAEQLRVLVGSGYTNGDQSTTRAVEFEDVRPAQRTGTTQLPPAENETARQAPVPIHEPPKALPLAGFGAGASHTGSAQQPLPDAQEQHLKSLIERYTRKTRGSKERTQRYRRALADPRTAAGFNRRWKEMVYPIWVERSQGSKLWDVDGNEYVDLLNGFGPNFFGHSASFVTEALHRQLQHGFEVGPQTPLVGEVAEMICQLTGMDRVSFTCSGSEAVQAAMRLSRTFTGRDKIVLFSRDYHGNFDQVLVREANRPGKLKTVPSAPGIPFQSVDDTYVMEYGTDETLDIIRKHADEIAAVIVEPVQSRRPEFQPRGFLHQIRGITREHGIVLVFDEVVTGFRIAPGGAQEYFGIEADLATYGKVVAGGMPIGVVAGREGVMNTFDGGWWQYGDDSFPEAGVTFFAGTFVRHPLVMAAAHASLKHMIAEGPALQERVARRAASFASDLNGLFRSYDVDIELAQFGSIMYLRNHEHSELAGLLHYNVRYNGVHLQEGFPCYMTDAHSEADIRHVLAAFKNGIEPMVEAGIIGKRRGTTPPPQREQTGPLRAEEVSTVGAVASIEVKSGPSRYPSTPLQREMWLAAQINPDASAANNGSNVIQLTGPLDVSMLKQAIGELIRRHEALRCTFSGDGGEVIVHDFRAPEVPFHDASESALSAQDKLVAQILEADGRQVFDLSQGPLCSFRIIKLSSDSHLLVYTAQMIVCDGWGFKVVIEELGQIYTALVEKRLPRLGPAQQMREYVAWLTGVEGRKLEQQSEEYWLSKFDPLPLPLDFRTSRYRPPNRTFSARRETLRLPSEFHQRIKHRSKELRNTPFATLLTAFAVWLHRLSASDDLVISVPFAGQGPLEFKTMVGQGVHTFPIRFMFNPSESFRDVLARTRGLVLDSQDHWNTNLGSIVRKLDFPGDPSRLPLTTVMFNMDPAMSDVGFKGCRSSVVSGPRFFFTYDIGFNVVDEGDTLLLECDYNDRLFNGQFVASWMTGFRTLLEGILADPSTPLRDLPMADGEESADPGRSSPQEPAPMDSVPSVHSLFSAHLRDRREGIALSCGDRRVPYAELDGRSTLLAERILSRGMQAGWTVAVSLDDGLDYCTAALGVLKAGCALVTMHPGWSEEQAQFVLSDSGAVLLIADPLQLQDRWSRTGLPCLNLHDEPERLALQGGMDGVSTMPDECPACVFYPAEFVASTKPMTLTHQRLAVCISDLATRWSVSSKDILARVNYQSSLLGLVEILLALSSGAQIVFAQKSVQSQGDGFGQWVEESGVNVILATTSLWQRLLRLSDAYARCLKIICLGDLPPHSLPRKILGRFSEVHYVYGRRDGSALWLAAQLDAAGPDRPLAPLAGIGAQVFTSTGEVAPLGTIGDLVIADTKVDVERLALPDRGVETGSIRTGQLARRLPDKQIEVLGPAARQCVVKQGMVNPSDVEAVLFGHPMTEDAAVLPSNGDCQGSRLVAYAAHGGANADGVRRFRNELRGMIDETLPAPVRPAAIVVMESLPRNRDGSVLLDQLPAVTVADESLGSGAASSARNATEANIARIWSEVLNIQSPSVTDNFFEVGGQSFQAVSLFAKLEKEFGSKLPLAVLLKNPTIEALARVVEDGSSQAVWSTLVPIQPEGSRPPLFLVHGAGGNVLLFRALADRLSPDCPVYGLQSKGLDGKSEPLRTIEAMAQEYLREIRSIQPHGPYHLGGYCLGGTIAYEMGQLLEREGEKVALLAMLDTYNYSRALQVSFHSFVFQKIRFHLSNISELGPRAMLKYLKEKGRLALSGELRNLKTSAPRGTPEESAGRATSGIELSIQAINDRAAEEYLPMPYPGDVTMIKPRINYKFYPDPKMGYGDLIQGRLELVEVGSNPHAMLLEPHVEVLAKEIKERIDRSSERLGSRIGVANRSAQSQEDGERQQRQQASSANDLRTTAIPSVRTK